jgi:hypothetical protein
MGRKAACVSPARVVGYGAAAGMAGTLVITAPVRIIPWHKPGEPSKKPAKPASDSPEQTGGLGVESAMRVTPAGALAEGEGPGTEGAAELFLVKVGSGLFDRDLSNCAKPASKGVHFAYGTAWGALYGLGEGGRRVDPSLAGLFTAR